MEVEEEEEVESNLSIRNKNKQNSLMELKCDQMARLLWKYFAIVKNDNWITAKNCQGVIRILPHTK